MMTEYQEMVLVKMLLALGILVAMFIIYFVFNKNVSFWQRLLAASHSLITIAAAIYAINVCKYTGPSSFEPHTLIFSNILAIAAIFSILCLFLFKGDKRIHFLLFVFLLCLANVWHIGGLAITHALV